MSEVYCFLTELFAEPLVAVERAVTRAGAGGRDAVRAEK